MKIYREYIIYAVTYGNKIAIKAASYKIIVVILFNVNNSMPFFLFKY